MPHGIFQNLRGKTRNEWSDLIKRRYSGGRAWVQTNGEWAAAAGFIVGVAIVIFFRLIFTLLVIGAAAAAAIWLYAPNGTGNGRVE